MTEDSGKDKKSYSLTVQDGPQAASPKKEDEPKPKAGSPSDKSPHKKLQKLHKSSSVKDMDTKPSPQQKKKTKPKKTGLAKITRELSIDTGRLGGRSKFNLPDLQSGALRGRTRRSRSAERTRTDSDGFTTVTSPGKKSVARSPSSPPASRSPSEGAKAKTPKPNPWCPNPFQPLDQDDESTLDDALNTTIESTNTDQQANDPDDDTDQDFHKAKQE